MCRSCSAPNDQALVQKMRSLREFGKAKKGIYINYYEMFGYNWRIPEVAALIGLHQLANVDAFIARRRQTLATTTASSPVSRAFASLSTHLL